jgi:hypothetical protein
MKWAWFLPNLVCNSDLFLSLHGMGHFKPIHLHGKNLIESHQMKLRFLEDSCERTLSRRKTIYRRLAMRSIEAQATPGGFVNRRRGFFPD